MSKRGKRGLVSTIFTIICCVVFVGVYTYGYFQDKKLLEECEKYDLNGQNAVDVINSSERVEVVKKTTSLRRTYYIFVEDKLIATVTGKFIHPLGDTFTMKDLEGNEIISEKEHIQLTSVTKSATVSDGTKVKQDVFKDFARRFKYHLLDKDNNEYAYTDGNIFGVPAQVFVYNSNDEKIFVINGDYEIVNRGYTVVKYQDSDCSMAKAVLLTTMIDTIRDDTD